MTDPGKLLPRTDEVNTVLHMLSAPQTSTVILEGDAGVGKSTLVALLFHRLQATAQAGSTSSHNFVWLSLGPNATLPDTIFAILNSMHMSIANFFLLKPEQQIAFLWHALRQPQTSTYVILDQFDELLNPASSSNRTGRSKISFLLEMMKQDLGQSRFLLTCYRSPFHSQNHNYQEMRIRSYVVSHLNLPEGLALLQHYSVQGSQQELSLVWQKCGGHLFALTLFGILATLSNFTLSYLLDSPDYQSMWSENVTLNLIGAVYYYLNPIQRTLLRTLCLFNEPVPLEAIVTANADDNNNFAATSSSPEIRHEQSTHSTFERELAALTRISLVQETPGEDGLRMYYLHPLLQQYTIEHYLEGSNHHTGGNPSSALGVATVSHPMEYNAEAQQIALAAGHMRVVNYYAHLAQKYCPLQEKRSSLQDIEPLLAVVRHLCLGWHWQEAYDLLSTQGLHESMMRWGAWNALIELYSAMLPPHGILNRHDFAPRLQLPGFVLWTLGRLPKRATRTTNRRWKFNVRLATCMVKQSHWPIKENSFAVLANGNRRVPTLSVLCA